ncbi:MAG TPA: tRNA dihydrouridine(20/20a) synthase DusA, partial [Burkholderiaceae bacterium]|nr:tRNA dihydrouridine(20/20a) synthase DusA [Burkholderiaceae bacterium]
MNQSVAASNAAPQAPSHRFCVAPMIAWTDRHCRHFHRALSRHARLYTEMITTGALIHGPRERLLAFDPVEHPVAIQLGGCDPADLARCARMAERAGYDEINLNCGCPSERVQRGSFGACLMAEPALVADCVRAMRDAVSVPVTVKHRIGLDRSEDYGFVRDFVGELARAGCEVFIAHARNAWLKGLNPKENRDIPPLRYEVVRRLACDFPDRRFVLNGGIRSHDEALRLLDEPGPGALAGVMLGREAYGNPWMLAEVDTLYFGQAPAVSSREPVVDAMRNYVLREAAAGTEPRAIVRHMLGLFNGLPGARRWRRMLSDTAALAREGERIIDTALETLN